MWYKRFRATTYVSAIVSLIWTVLIVLPFEPFSSLPPIIVGGRPGTWFLLAFLLYVIIGIGGFGVFSALLYVIETYERRVVDQSTMLLGFVLLNIGVAASCILLALAGGLGGYAMTINNVTQSAAERILNPFIYPITITTLMAVIGAALTLVAMIRAKVSPT